MLFGTSEVSAFSSVQAPPHYKLVSKPQMVC